MSNPCDGHTLKIKSRQSAVGAPRMFTATRGTRESRQYWAKRKRRSRRPADGNGVEDVAASNRSSATPRRITGWIATASRAKKAIASTPSLRGAASLSESSSGLFCRSLATRWQKPFYEGDLQLYTSFPYPVGWEIGRVVRRLRFQKFTRHLPLHRLIVVILRGLPQTLPPCSCRTAAGLEPFFFKPAEQQQNKH